MLEYIDSLVWGAPMLVLLLGSHLWLSVRTRFIQRKIGLALKLSVTKDAAAGDISAFGALATALSATIGTGNIVGVASAILAGGPGAILWMWLVGVFGMATKYSETLIALRYRVKDAHGEMLGGAMIAWQVAFPKTWWSRLGAISFAAFAAIAAFGIGAGVQSSAMTSIIRANVVWIPSWAIGLVIALTTAAALFGGIKVLARICEALVPAMAIFYALGCLIIIAMNHAYILQAITLIVSSAVSSKAAFGGAVGAGVMQALQFGCARGLFSNESGMGSAPIVASAASSTNPCRQSLVSMTGTFWDTVVICALTGIMLISTMLAHPEIAEEILKDPSSFSAAMLTSAAFRTIPYVGTPILILGMIMFAYSTVLGWSYYGQRAATFLFGLQSVRIYQLVYVLVCFVGAIGVSQSVWILSDITNALMVVPNIILVLMLTRKIQELTDHYVWAENIDEVDTREIPTREHMR